MSFPQALPMVVRPSAIRNKEGQRGQWRYASSRCLGISVLPGSGRRQVSCCLTVTLSCIFETLAQGAGGGKEPPASASKYTTCPGNRSIREPSACFLPRARRRDRLGFL